MSSVDTKAEQEQLVGTPISSGRVAPRRRSRVLPLLITMAIVTAAAVLGRSAWNVYMEAPWTRDGTVRAYVVTTAPEVAGRIVELPIADNQFVHKGDLLMVVDPTNYKIAERLAETAVQRAQVAAQNAASESKRREELSSLAVTVEEKQIYDTNAATAQAKYQETVAKLQQAQVDLKRTEIRAPVNGWVTNLSAQLGDYATVGKDEISLVDADSFWIDAYFEETFLGAIRDGERATIKLMGYSRVLHGRVGGIARGINVGNARPNGQGLATVNPIFTWVRLAQRIPVHIRLDDIPANLHLVAGQTATVQLDPHE